MNMRRYIFILASVLICSLFLTGCFSAKSASSSGRGGEVVGVGGKVMNEPTPYGMVRVNRGFLKMGLSKQDSLWGKSTPTKDISVDGFWMDQTEITNSQYKQFLYWVRDSILRTRLADPSYGGDESYMITEDKNGDPVTPHLNWNKRLPRKPNEDEQRAIESLYVTNPVTGEKLLDWKQMNYKYEVYDYVTAALRRNRLNPADRNLNTDVTVDPNEEVMISKDTAYVDDDGNIVRQTINRPLSGPWDFLNTYIVNIYPDTTCWVNDFQMGASQCLLCLAYRLPAQRLRPRGTLCSALPSADRGRMGVCRAWQGPERIPMGKPGCGEWQRMLLCQFQTRPWKLHQGRQSDHSQGGQLFRQFQWTLRHGRQRCRMDQYRLYRGWRGRNE